MRPTPTEFVRWLFLDAAFRQDRLGKGAPTGHRRYRNGARMLIHSRKLLDPNAVSDIWGICYQDNDSRVQRGDDLLYRLTLAGLAIVDIGMKSVLAACNELVSDLSVSRVCGFMGTEKEVNTLRVRICQYRKRCEKKGISLIHDLKRMQEYWRYLHLDEMRASEWHNDLLEEFRSRVIAVDEEIQKCSDPGERGVLNRLRLHHCGTLASELHDSERFEDGPEYYEVVIEGLQDNNGEFTFSVMLDWYMEQSERCKRKEPREHTPVLMDGLVTRIG